MEVIGTTPWTGEVEPRQEQRSRVESGTETEGTCEKSTGMSSRYDKALQHIVFPAQAGIQLDCHTRERGYPYM
ncbi:MAG: hypothetical protein ACI9ZT_001186 [Gammaproteobacteria bacterium]|jgi:hypothetical protein